MWIKPDVFDGNRGLFYALNGHALSPRARTDTNGDIFFQARINGVNDDATLSNMNLATGVWQHVVLTFDNDNGNLLRGYKDGLWINETDDLDDGSLDGGSSNLGIGEWSSTANDSLDGLIDDVRVYNRVLSPEEIKRLYNPKQ
jgi:hypothetical protein